MLWEVLCTSGEGEEICTGGDFDLERKVSFCCTLLTIKVFCHLCSVLSISKSSTLYITYSWPLHCVSHTSLTPALCEMCTSDPCSLCVVYA